MIWTLLKFTLVIFFPKILNTSLDLLKRRHRIRESIKISRYSKADLLPLSAVVIFWLSLVGKFYGFPPHPNYFAETKTPFDAASYLVRNHYRYYMDYLQNNDPLVQEYLSFVGTDNFEEISEIPEKYAKVASDLKRLDFLSQEMRVKENIRLYFLAGEKSFLECSLCDKKQPYEFIIYASPYILIQYAFFFLAVGILCRKAGRQNILTPAIIFIFCVASHDVFSFYFSGYFSPVWAYEQLFAASPNYLTKYEQLEIIRSCLMLLFLSIVLVFEFPPQRDETLVLLEKTISEAKQISDKLLVERASKGVILADDQLRKPFVESLKKSSTNLLGDLSPLERQRLAAIYATEQPLKTDSLE